MTYIKMEADIDLTPNQLAEMFVNWGNHEQALFLNLIGLNFRKVEWDGEWQCHSITEEIDNNGRDFIYTLANFLKVKNIPSTSPKFNHLIDFYPDCESLLFNKE
jgi:hypothetical protein